MPENGIFSSVQLCLGSHMLGKMCSFATLSFDYELGEQVKPGFTNYQPQGLADQIKFEV